MLYTYLSSICHHQQYLRRSFETVSIIVDLFLKSSNTLSSSFHVSKVGNRPARQNASATVSIESSQNSVLEDLNTILASFTASQTEVTYSVHYSDINGLSRLENHLLAHEISEYFGKGLFYTP